MSNTSTSSGGIGFAGLLTITFIVLKLTGIISWAWVWVLSPVWIGGLLVIAVLAILGIALLVASVIDNKKKKSFLKKRGN